MATLKNTTINDTRFLLLPVGTTAGNNGDSDRGGAGSSGVAGSTPANGKVIILA